MSIATRTGDTGTTGLMYNRRVPKTHPRVEACGAVDELNAAIGVARSVAAGAKWLTGELLTTQQELVVIMGELATELSDFERYVADGYPQFKSELVGRLDRIVGEIEGQNVSFKGWATPGENILSAALEVARTACRRAERRIVALKEMGALRNPDFLLYFNRLSDVLWLMARWAEAKA